MSKYTTEVRFICETASGLTESEGYKSVNEIITRALPKVFDFDFPIFDESYRSVLERKILKHFYTREIGEETVGLWKLRMDTRLNEIMPYYNKLYESELLEFNPLYTSDLKREGNKHRVDDEGIVDKTDYEAHSTLGNTHDDRTDVDTWNLYSDTPQGALTGVVNESYLTNATKNTVDNVNHGSYTNQNDGDSSTDYKRDRDVDSVEDYLEKVVGYNGANPSDMLMKYRQTFLNIDMRIIEELDDLFMCLW